mmetsp:Transcript_37524/g.49345  ORF Transcript_37524/g.49345 Transcript_37524/m.49345 type:complete len:138 (+) Transcript_37524:525-938(+)
MQVVTFFILITCIVMASIALAAENESKYDNMTIYTQAVSDWGNDFWVDFTWGAEGNCPFYYEPIYALWGGTYPGNNTAYGEPIIIENEGAYQIDPIGSVRQVKLYKDMRDALCGRRANNNMLRNTNQKAEKVAISEG